MNKETSSGLIESEIEKGEKETKRVLESAKRECITLTVNMNVLESERKERRKKFCKKRREEEKGRERR